MQDIRELIAAMRHRSEDGITEDFITLALGVFKKISLEENHAFLSHDMLIINPGDAPSLDPDFWMEMCPLPVNKNITVIRYCQKILEPYQDGRFDYLYRETRFFNSLGISQTNTIVNLYLDKKQDPVMVQKHSREVTKEKT